MVPGPFRQVSHRLFIFYDHRHVGGAVELHQLFMHESMGQLCLPRFGLRFVVGELHQSRQQCQGRRQGVPPGVIGQRKGPRQLFREDVTQTSVATDGTGESGRFPGRPMRRLRNGKQRSPCCARGGSCRGSSLKNQSSLGNRRDGSSPRSIFSAGMQPEGVFNARNRWSAPQCGELAGSPA